MDKRIVLIFAFIIFALSGFASFKYFSAQTPKKSVTKTTAKPGESFVDNGPRTEECPMNGELYSKDQKEIWEQRRPAGAMIQNHQQARPQSGLSSADIVHEAVAEGGITRFLAIYYCENPEIIGSVRSVRIYFLKLLQAFGDRPLFMHVGGANTEGPADALGEIADLGWTGANDMDNFGVGLPVYKRLSDRLPDRDFEHTVYAYPNEMWKYAAEKRGFTNVDEDGKAWDEDFTPYKFIDEAKDTDRGNIGDINFGFWDNSLGSDFTVNWKYDKATNLYSRTNGGKPHIDLNTNKQLTTKNVMVAFVDESVANDGYDHGEHLLYDIIGTGEALVFQNGKVIEGTWKKPEAEQMLRFYGEDGKELPIVRGKVWIEILPTGNDVDYAALKSTSPAKK